MECRTCLGYFDSSEVINVETKITDQKSVLQAINEVASIEVRESEVLPKYICKMCFRLLESAVTFRMQIIVSHLELKKRQTECELIDPLFISCDDQIICEETKVLKDDLETEHDEKVIIKLEDLKEIEKICASEKTAPNANRRSDELRIKTSALRARRKTRKKPLSSDSSDSDTPLETIQKGKNKHEAIEGVARLCPICGKLFKARQSFNSHMTTTHRKRNVKPNKFSYLCPDCGRVITGTRQNFVAHRRYHHSDKAQVKKRFTCDLCPRRFYREKNLIIHQRIHKGEKGYVCELCPDKSYTQIGGLILHKRKVHLKKPTYTCNYCGKQFYEKHYLETHIRQWHTGERPFSCEICGKAFSCNGTLLRHRKDSHGEKKPCPKCGKMYTEGELRKHLKRHKIREEGIKRKKYTCEYCSTEMNFTSRKRHLLNQHGIMLRGRGENAERIPISRADAM